MEIGKQIKKHRQEMALSQEELAEKIYVTRQTISNWENGKNYPDIHSLLLLSSLFHVTLDQLIKGDINIMKKEIDQAQIVKFYRSGMIFTLFFIASIVLFVPLVGFLNIYGVVIWSILYSVTLWLGFRVEQIKKKNDLHTYREIVAFCEGKPLDEIQKQREIGKRPYQNFFKFLCGAFIGIIAAWLALTIMRR